MTSPDALVSSFSNRVQTPAGRHGMSVDIEDYFQVWALSEVIQRHEWDSFALRVEDSTRKTMALFARHQVKATFFTLGWVAEKCPALIREIIAQGHELASHGYDHTKVFDQTREQFFEDIRKTKMILEDISGVAVNGFRAAGFSIDGRTPWAFEALYEAGYIYSSSLHPIAHDHYHMPDASPDPYYPLGHDGFYELPVATVSAYGRRLSCAGGGWFRLLPYAWSAHLLAKMIQQEKRAAVFYFHPWEIDPEQPRIEGLGLKSQLRHYTNLHKMESKLDRLLAAHDWGRIDDVFGLAPSQEAA